MKSSDAFQVETLLAQALGARAPMGGLTPSISPATTFEHGTPQGPIYSRDQNPTTEPVEALLAALEGGSSALLFASGMAAATAVLESLQSGERIVAPQAMYWALRNWIQGFAERRGVDLVWVDASRLDSWKEALSTRTALVWIETPANPRLELTDILAVATLAHAADAKVIVDNTVATPLLTRPLALGADLVLHSASKSLNGHSDVIAGALVCQDPALPLWEYCRYERANRGAVLGPFEASLLLRGMRTLALRVQRSAENAQKLAQFLAAHPGVSEVYYPGLTTHPQRALAERQMPNGSGSLLSLRIRAGKAGAARVIERLEVFAQATSLGGVESLVEQRALVEGPGSGLPEELLRLSIGIEAISDLIDDFKQALSV